MRIISTIAAAATTLPLLYALPVASSTLHEQQNQQGDDTVTQIEVDTPPTKTAQPVFHLQPGGNRDSSFAPATSNEPALTLQPFTALETSTTSPPTNAPATTPPKTQLSINTQSLNDKNFGLFPGQRDDDDFPARFEHDSLAQNLVIRDYTQMRRRFGNDDFSLNASAGFITAPEQSYLHGNQNSAAFVASLNTRFAYQGFAAGLGVWSDSSLPNGIYNQIWSSYTRNIGGCDLKGKFLLDRQTATGRLNEVTTFSAEKKLPVFFDLAQKLAVEIDNVKPSGPGAKIYQNIGAVWSLARQTMSFQIATAYRDDTRAAALTFAVRMTL